MSALRRLSIYGVANAAVSAVSLAVTPFIARNLGPSAFAEATMFVYVLWVLNVLVSLNSVALFNVKFMKIGRAELGVLISSVFFLSVLISVFVGGVAYLFLVFTDLLVFQKYSWFVIIGLPVNLFALAYQLNQSRMMLERDAAGFAFTQFSFSLLAALLSVVLIFFWRNDEFSRVLALSVAYVVMGFFGWCALRRVGVLGFRFDRNALFDGLRFLLPLLPHMASVFVLNILDRLLVASLAGNAAAGLYISAAFLASSVGVFLSAANRALTPEIYDALRRRGEGALKHVYGILLKYSGCAIVASLGVWFLADFSIDMLFGSQYRGSGQYFKWLFVGQAIWAVYTVVSVVLIFFEKSSQLSAVTLVAAGVHLTLMFVFFQVFGVIGFCYAYVFAMVVRLVLTAVLARRAYDECGEIPDGA